MKGEGILYANCANISIEGIKAIFEKYNNDGHEIIGVAKDLSEVEELVARGIKPTVFMYDPDFPGIEMGKKTLDFIRQKFPDITVITLPGRGRQWGDINLSDQVEAEDLMKILTGIELRTPGE